MWSVHTAYGRGYGLCSWLGDPRIAALRCCAFGSAGTDLSK